MKYRGLLVLACCTWVLVVAVPGRAQPEEEVPARTATEEVDWRDQDMRTPQQTVKELVKMSSPRFFAEHLAYFVAGTKPDAPYGALDLEIESMLGEYRLKIEDGDIEVAIERDRARAKVSVTATHLLGMSLKWQENLKLRRETVADGQPIWRLVPEGVESVTEPTGTAGVLQQTVNMLAYPRQTLTRSYTYRGLSKIQLLNLAAIQFVQDNETKLSLTPETIKEQLRPYTRHDKEPFVAPGDAAEVESFSFNGKLTGAAWDKIEKPETTVMFYLGKEGKLDFRYDGKTLIGYADGHAKAVTAEEAKNLKWEP